MKNQYILITCLLFIFSSCTIEDEFTELTPYDDVLVETLVYFKDAETDYDIQFVYYKTDGYNNLTTRNSSFSGSVNDGREIFSQMFKKYRKGGIKIVPGENVDYILVTFYELSWSWDLFFQYRHNSKNEFTLMYDFESETYEVIED